MQIEGGNIKIGVLSLQGGVREHINHLNKLNIESIEVKKCEDLDFLDGLILPGGESTTLGIILKDTGILDRLVMKINSGFPVWGTCAGLILLAKKIDSDNTVHLGVLDVEVKRNGYGRQLDSFQHNEVFPMVDNTKEIPLVFIRAPYIKEILSNNVEVLGEVKGKIVAVRQNNIMGTAFHPELTEDLTFHKFFIEHCKKYI